MKIVLLGEQATGKSSLLVALYGALVNRRAGEMRIVRTVDDVEFLSRGLQALGRRESVRRTEVDAQARLLIDVAHGDAVVSIELPDRSGELVRHMIEARQWEGELQRQLAGASGAILCLRADHAAGADARRDRRARSEPADAAAAAGASSTPPPWTPGADAGRRARRRPAAGGARGPHHRPAARVVLSAWDRAQLPTAPDAWLAEHVPLLEQFLATHDGQLPHQTFGVSAQGARLRRGRGRPRRRRGSLGPRLPGRARRERAARSPTRSPG